MPSDTFVTHAPDWRWLVILYFFFGGISAGSYVFSAILDFFGRPSDRELSRVGYLISFPALALCPIFLILDLGRPERFWHMLFQSNTGGIMLKTYSPMSIGAWGLAVFGIFVTLAFFGALSETGPLSFIGKGVLRKLLAAVGVFPGFFVAGYTGVLLSTTNRPIWGDTTWIGALFLLSAATTSAALMLWLGRNRATPSSLSWLARVEGWVAILELVVLVVMLVTLGPVNRVWMGMWGVLLAIAVVVGVVAPMALRRQVVTASALVLLGGLALRAVVILASEAV